MDQGWTRWTWDGPDSLEMDQIDLEWARQPENGPDGPGMDQIAQR